MKNIEAKYWERIKELTERKCLVEVKKGVTVTRNDRDYYGVRFVKMPYHMKAFKVSDKMYRFVYDEKASPNWANFRVKFDEDMSNHYFALFKINDYEYCSYDFTDDDDYSCYKKIFTQHNQTCTQVTGYVTQLYQVHVSMLDFYNLTGYTFKEWNSQVKKSGGLVMEWDTTNDNCSISVYYEPSNAKYKKILKAPKKSVLKGERQFNTTTLNFYLPQIFTDKGYVKPGQILIDSVTFNDVGRMRLTIEALPRTCSCCGKPIFWNDEICKAGYVCKPCDTRLEKARAIIEKSCNPAKPYRLEQTQNAITANKERILSAASKRLSVGA